jgi:hypothetical protein
MDWNQRPLFRNPHDLTGGGSVGMPIPGYLTGSTVENITFGSPAMVGRSRAEVQQEELNYEKLIRKAAAMYAQSDPTSWGYEADLHRTSRDISFSTAEIMGKTKEEVMEDLRSAIAAQRNSLSNGYMHGGIIGLEEAGLVPELFEGQEIVEIIPDLNQMALEGNGGIPSSRAAGAELPERNIPSARNEEGIIQLALDTEEFEDDEPIVALAEQEAKSRLDEEFIIIKSTAQADAATGNAPAFVIKSSMEDLARAAQRIEVETVEKYPEVPFDANLISSDDLVPYREELVAMFEVPELGQEEFLMAENGGLIPGYQGAGEVLPEEWAWMNAFSFGKELIEAGRKGLIDLREAERRMLKRYGPIINEMRQKGSTRVRKKAEKRKKYESYDLTLLQLEEAAAKRIADTREKDFLKGLDETDFMIDANPLSTAGPLVAAGYPGQVTNPDVRFLLKKYPDLVKEYEASKGPMPVSDDTEKIDETYRYDDSDLLDAVNQVMEGYPERDKGIDIALPFTGGASTPPDTGAITGQPSSSVDLLEQIMGTRPDIAQIQADLKTRKTELQETLTGKESGISQLEVRLEKLISDPKTGHEKKASDLDKEMDEIFKDMAKRIPRQARYASMTAPASAAGGQGLQFFTRRYKGKEMEENLFQKLNVIKLDYKSIRKAEAEARRNNDFSLLMNLSMKKQELLADLENTAFDADNKIKVAQIEQAFSMELEVFKGKLEELGLGTGTGTAAVDRAKRDQIKVNTALEGLDPEKDADQIEMLEQLRIYNDQIIMGTASIAGQIANIMGNTSLKQEDKAIAILGFSPETLVSALYNFKGEKNIKEPFGLPGEGLMSFPEFYAAAQRTFKTTGKAEKQERYSDKDIIKAWLEGKYDVKPDKA